MNAKVLREGRVRLWLEPEDRGLAYGDGVFETLRVCGGVPAMWREHWARLCIGATRLGIALPEEALVRCEAESLVADRALAALKIILTRGVGLRGYAAPEVENPTVVLTCSDVPALPEPGLVLRWCKTRMAVQPLLAGIKHLNRLEQVLARAEWNDPGIHDGILCDREDRVVCTTSANLFARIEGRWLTPTVANCGVAGTIRGWLLAQGAAVEAELSQAQVSHAEVLFACNALRGILPVRRLGQHDWPAHPEVLALRRRLADAHPAYAFQE